MATIFFVVGRMVKFFSVTLPFSVKQTQKIWLPQYKTRKEAITFMTGNNKKNDLKGGPNIL